ncbi:siphovirus ReqiPepy6 Gp37-like family protein [Amycolatopsis speibonae]|uniref:Siphovirus ReqiPepy6 Gp37-like family protein n=1 Tax=Amycolatopsis speibonae TaxID=1450224 RepID=A0ABV7P7T1_9PSEU
MTWKIYVRDKDNSRVGELDDYTEAKLAPVYNDVGSWSLTLSRKSLQAANLTTPGAGIIVTRDDEGPEQVVFSGPALSWEHRWDLAVNHVAISGSTDDVCLLSRLVSPSPGQSTPPYDTQAVDVRTGVASTVIRQYVNVNLGPGAVPARRKSDLTLSGDPVIGASVRGEGRWDSDLLAFIQPLAITGGVGFRVVQNGTGLLFEVYAPTNRSGEIKFSRDLGNLLAFQYSNRAPTTNYIYVGASGTGTTRIIKEFQDPGSIATWGRQEGPLANESSTSDTTAITQVGTEALEQGQEQAALSFTPIEIPGMRYGLDYFLGDTVTVQLEDTVTPYEESGQIVDQIRNVEISLTPDKTTITPSVGTGQRGDIPRLFRAYRQLHRRVNNIERV